VIGAICFYLIDKFALPRYCNGYYRY